TFFLYLKKTKPCFCMVFLFNKIVYKNCICLKSVAYFQSGTRSPLVYIFVINITFTFYLYFPHNSYKGIYGKISEFHFKSNFRAKEREIAIGTIKLAKH